MSSVPLPSPTLPFSPAEPVAPRRPEPISPRIDDPMALLRACHEKVVRFTTLAQRLQAHVGQQGVDEQAREAAQAVLRYFTLAAPLHHADEDDNLFVALRGLNRSTLTARIDALQAEHDALGQRWTEVQPWLEAVAAGHSPGGVEPDVDGFAKSYRKHAQAEETEVYPHAAELSEATLRALADAMVARRQPKAAR
ncbi:hemerythrin domain-containing protein [Aquabacterium parvum]|jgi:hemerythrin-like domain-containing protein|uniref:hemerythrin domain-containing protein n=1 Tax=Aquabacterium parvum TaxID=70584 RepID=UPI000718C307|nr:hemerythrin domain-containing protein [Aquabacterium parvum]MBU0915593.1 hemerythrin domain-containing protein [Gammaproteobacteria bacterium]